MALDLRLQDRPRKRLLGLGRGVVGLRRQAEGQAITAGFLEDDDDGAQGPSVADIKRQANFSWLSFQELKGHACKLLAAGSCGFWVSGSIELDLLGAQRCLCTDGSWK